MLRRKLKPGEYFLLRLPTGSDLLESLERHVRETGITIGYLSGLGAVSRAVVAYYDQSAQEYRQFPLERHLEITNLIGNVSLRDGQPMVHAHATFADEDGSAFGGHVAPGTLVFAAEVALIGLEGPALIREHDQATGLPLWRADR